MRRYFVILFLCALALIVIPGLAAVCLDLLVNGLTWVATHVQFSYKG